MTVEQLPLFPGDQPQVASEPAAAPSMGLTARSSLSAAMERFQRHMVEQEFAENTVKSFMGDLKLLRRYLKGDPPIGQIGTPELERFLHWLRSERGAPCSSKSYARRMTTLKVFFAWLAESRVVPADPAAPLIHQPAKTPMPLILHDDQVEQVLAVARQLMGGPKPDPRPYLLISLVLHTGIKKQECMAIKLAHIDTSDRDGPALQVRYDRPRMQYKERRLRLPADWPRVLALYREVYKPQETLFPCTPRNLEYVLADVAKLAGLPEGLSFEMLRWTCAVRDYRGRMDSDHLRRKLGLSQISWNETEPRIVKLAEPPL
jgi:site-specific recombinase XerD